ncbi:MAG: hypothetical protein ACI9S8_002289 [Chlamydiales bacterium]|jgi:uncharacterized protein (DUF1499 family)
MFEKTLLFSFLSMILICSGCSLKTENPEIFQRFSPCPNSPKCVSSVSSKSDHFIDPITYTGTANPMERLSEIMKEMPRVKTITEEEDYLHYEVRSIFFRFVDDVEFSHDKKAGLIHIKSGAGIGYYDFGVNRRRLEKARKEFNNRLTNDMHNAKSLINSSLIESGKDA